MDRSELAAAIYTTSRLLGAFQLRSGRTTSEYFDKYRFESDPILLRAIAEQAAGHIPPGTEVLAGLELGGVPVATALSLESGLPVVFVRKVAKSYGITSGGQVALSGADLRERGAVIDDVLCVVDRGEGGGSTSRSKGWRCAPCSQRRT